MTKAAPRRIEPMWLTVIVSLSTLGLAVATIWLVWESRQASYRQLGVETWMHFEERWDSAEMKKARYDLAAALQPSYNPSKADDIPVEVMDFFESVGSVWSEGLMNSKLAEMSFSYDATGWWQACEAYVSDQRQKNADKTIYDKFERFGKAMEAKYGKAELSNFLKEQEAPTSAPP
jgi:hypothetical protein